MKYKTIYNALACVLVACGSANASYLTDDSERAGAMTLFAGSPSGTAGNSGADTVDFTTASQTKIDLKQGIAPGEFIRLQGVVQHVGKDMYAMPQFVEYLKACIRQYKPGMQLNAQEVQITEEDRLNIAHLRKFMVKDFFKGSITHHQPEELSFSSEGFKRFKQSRSGLSGEISHYNNSVMLALMYFFDLNKGPVSIKKPSISYGNLRFQFSPCPDEKENSGIDLKFAFESSDFYGVLGFPRMINGSTVSEALYSNSLFNPGSTEAAEYTFGLFKVAADTFRMNVKLATIGKYDSILKDRKITNFLVELQS